MKIKNKNNKQLLANKNLLWYKQIIVVFNKRKQFFYKGDTKMETIKQVEEEFNEKKTTKKKGLVTGGIIVAAIIVALALIYFLIITNPKFIFSKAIDKILTVDSKKYESVKVDTKIKADVDLENATYQANLSEIEKYTLKAGIQMDAGKKQEIIDLGLEYDNQEVIDAQLYYNEGEVYAYFEGLFDKYIKIDMDEEAKAELDEIFESATSEENLKDAEKAIKIMRDELKTQIKENGKFESKKDEIEIGDEEVKVTKLTLTISEKQLYKIAENMLSNLRDNDEFLDCFEESPKDLLKEAKDKIKDLEGNNKNNIKISLYTKGLLKNKIVAVNFEAYSEDENSTIVASITKENEDEDENVYAYKVTTKTSGTKIDLLKGKVEIEKGKDTKKEQSGKVIITSEVIRLGSAKLEIDYSVETNSGIDKINTKNSVNMKDITEADIQSIMTKLMQKPLISELIKESSATQNIINPNTNINVNPNLNTNLNTNTNVNSNTNQSTQNEVKNDDYSVKYSLPTGFVYNDAVTSDYSKYYDFEQGDSEIESNVSMRWTTESEYVDNEINSGYRYWSSSEDYKNVVLSEIKTINVGDKQFKYKVLSYESNFGYGYESKYQDVYVWYSIGNENLFTVELEAIDADITEDIIKGFLNINVTKLN